MIEPKVLKGFRDSLPAQEIRRKHIISTLESEFAMHGFVPIDTPVLEYTEVLLGKGGGETDKQIFHFQDNGGRDVAMRFDLTVPFARFMAAHQSQLMLPFKRFHVAKVWRGENPQKGRFREFFQCDFDIVGIDAAFADFEILSMMHSSLTALGIERFSISFAHRGLFNAFLSHIGCLALSVEILRIVDKLRKIGSDEVFRQLTEITGTSDIARLILDYIETQDNDPHRVLSRLSTLAGNETEYTNRMAEILEFLEAAGIISSFTMDPSITRGLDYYTGIVYETFLHDIPGIGSVCSGGRYNDLASLYTKEQLPGVGASVGIDRLLAALEELEGTSQVVQSSSDVIVLSQDEKLRPYYHQYASALRKHGIRCDIYSSDKKLAIQFKYAQANSIPYALLLSQQDVVNKTCTIRNLSERTDQTGLTLEEATSVIMKQRK